MSRCSICASEEMQLIPVAEHQVCRPCLERVSAEIRARKSGGRRRLYKIEEGRELAGVCGGVADAINMNRDWFRAITVLLAIFTGFIPVLIGYLLMAWALPTEDEVQLTS